VFSTTGKQRKRDHNILRGEKKDFKVFTGGELEKKLVSQKFPPAETLKKWGSAWVRGGVLWERKWKGGAKNRGVEAGRQSKGAG